MGWQRVPDNVWFYVKLVQGHYNKRMVDTKKHVVMLSTYPLYL